ncbi:MAG: hypothetical protein J2P28_09600 [Actinobacteria bacterium]|nr:hypothetical protein [Actinomycetota bacterium]
MTGRVPRWRVRVLAAVGALAAAVGVTSAAAPVSAPAAAAMQRAVADDAPIDPTAPPAINPVGYQACANALYLIAPNTAFTAPVVGWASAAKLDGATVVGWPDSGYISPIGADEGLQNSSGHGTDASGNSEVYAPCQRLTEQLDYHGQRQLPPFRATFIAFGFEPVTATVTLQQVGPLDRADCLEPDGTTSPDCPPLTAIVSQFIGGTSTFARRGDLWVVVTAALTMRISDVTVNGTPLNVGNDCHTDGELTSPSSPIDPGEVVLSGSNIPGVSPKPDYNNVLLGPGALAGTVTIPPFTGCGTGGENLDSLLTATVSGSGNQVKVVQGPPGTCPGSACIPADWTVTGGGTITATEPFQLGLRSGSTVFNITCPRSVVTVTLPNHQGPLRTDLGTVALAGMDNCSAANGSTWSIRQQAPAGIDGGQYNPDTGLVDGPVNDISLALEGTGPGTGVAAGGTPCTVIVTGHSDLTYTPPPDAQLNLLGSVANGLGYGDSVAVRTSTCPGIPVGLSTFASTVEMAPVNLGNLTITNP